MDIALGKRDAEIRPVHVQLHSLGSVDVYAPTASHVGPKSHHQIDAAFSILISLQHLIKNLF
jgi:hypothetical protein